MGKNSRKNNANKTVSTSATTQVEEVSNNNVQVPLEKPEQPPGTFDPNDTLTPEEIKECSEKVEQALAISNDKELNLMKSDVVVPGQEWCLVSFVGKGLKQETEELGMKIWGCFNDIKAAKKHADKLNKIEENKIFDIFILEMYTWARIPPDPQCIDDQNYHEEKLHELITDHKRQQLRAKEVFDLRKEKLSNNPDVNQFNRNKQVLKELMNDTIEEETEENTEETVQNEEALKVIHGEPLKLPKLEVIPKDEQSGVVSEKIQDGVSVLPSEEEKLRAMEEDDNPFNKKFYNKDSKVL